jgi:polyisoprenyl-teichoic acid--peptidoglycan teichoic acid transferase
MQQRRRKKLVWAMALTMTAMSYVACAWLWAAPYRRAEANEELPASRVSSVAAPAKIIASPAPPSRVEAVPNEAAPQAAEPVAALKTRTPPLSNTRNFLVIGLDRRPDGSGPALADTLVVVVLDERSQHVGLVSIPRDLYVDIPDSGTDRINTVYQVAKRSKRDPLALLSRVVADTLKLPIEHALALDLGVFERAVDAVGGVDVDVPCPIRDNFVDTRAEGGRRLLDLDAGRRHLDGATAAMYVRSRHGRSDFHRARRQQAVLLGVQHTLAGLGVLNLPDLWGAFESSVETDMRRIQLLSLGRRALSLDAAHLHGLVIGHEHVQGLRTAEGKAVLVANYEAIDAALAKLFSAESPGVRPKLAVCEPKNAALGPS